MISDSPKHPCMMVERKNASIDWYLFQRLFSLICIDPVFLWCSFCWQGLVFSEMLCCCSKAPWFVFAWTDIPWLKTTVATLGRLGITMAFEIVYLVNTELYPTTLRYVKISQDSFNFSLCFSPFPISLLCSKTWFSPSPSWSATAQCGWHILMRSFRR